MSQDTPMSTVQQGCVTLLPNREKPPTSRNQQGSATNTSAIDTLWNTTLNDVRSFIHKYRPPQSLHSPLWAFITKPADDEPRGEWLLGLCYDTTWRAELMDYADQRDPHTYIRALLTEIQEQIRILRQAWSPAKLSDPTLAVDCTTDPEDLPFTFINNLRELSRMRLSYRRRCLQVSAKGTEEDRA